MSFTQQEIDEFKAEALELLEVAEKSLLGLDLGNDLADDANSERFKRSYDAIFRSFHNLKGAAGMMELTQLQTHTHELENLLVGFKNASELPKDYISLFLRGIDATRHILDGKSVSFRYSIDSNTDAHIDVKPEIKSEAKTSVAKVPEILSSAVDEFIQESEEIIERVSNNLRRLEAGTISKDAIDALYRDVHSLKGTAYLFSYAKLGDVGHAMESALEKIRSGTHLTSPQLLDSLFKSLKVIDSLMQLIKTKASDELLAGAVSDLVKLLNLAADQLPLVGGARTTDAPAASAQSPAKESEGPGSIRVPVSLLDSLMTLMGEMVLVRNQVLQYSTQTDDLEFASMSKRLNVVTSEIQGELMKTRMQPIGNVLTKFNRVVRDLSHELGKNINITLSGSDTELDKSLLEAIKDPLTHIVRNSCDHGIETPSVRRQSGKSDVGTISIKAFHEGGQVVVEVSDDGKGLNPDVLIAKALEKGLITQAQSTKLSEKEIFNLIFAPGFSTAAKVTNVSGRGVGMDVVRTNIERIGGTVDLSSRTNAGTTIKIKIPLTLAIVPALIVKCGGGTFAVPQVQLEELVRVDLNSHDNKIEMIHGAPVYRLRGNVLPLIDMNQLLGLPQRSDKNSIANIAVLSAEQCSFGVIIDEIQDTADIVVKPLNRLLKSLQVYSGATVLGDGSVALIFDVLGISKVAQIARERVRTSDAEKNRYSSDLQDFLLVSLNSKTKHALVLSYVHRLEVFKQSDVELSGNQRVIRYGDVILPLISANALLGYDSTPSTAAALPVIVIKRAGQLYGIEVNSILDTLSTPAALDPSLGRQPGVFGNLNLKDELVVVVDPFELITRAFGQVQTSEVATAITPENKVAIAAPTSKPTAQNILLVEDNVFFRKTIKHILEHEGYLVMTANDGEEALQMMSQNSANIYLVVSDIEMPRVNGFELAAQLRKNPTYSHIPLMAVSSMADKKAVQRGTQAGFDVYLEKLQPTTLLSKVSELTRKPRGVA